MLLLKFRNCGWVSERVVQARHRKLATGRGSVRRGGSIGKNAPDCEDFRRNLRTSERAAWVEVCGRDDFGGWMRQKARIFGKMLGETQGIPGSCPDPEKPPRRTMYRQDPCFRIGTGGVRGAARAKCVRVLNRICISVPGSGVGLAGAGGGLANSAGVFVWLFVDSRGANCSRVITEHRVIKEHRGSSSWPI